MTTMIDGLYFITPGGSAERIVAATRAALRGGARTVQYRDKARPAAAQVELARTLGALCREAGALFIVNDDPQVARDGGADGVHLGQGDGDVAAARAVLGAGRIVGVSTRTVEMARRAAADGADYIGLGAMYPTGSKDDAVLVGVGRLREVRAAVSLPIVAIGGISYSNAGEVIDAGADAVAVMSAVAGDPQPVLAARELALLFRRRHAGTARVLTIAGSDSGGGAGIQADLKVITLLGAFGMSAITALTAQNTLGVAGVHPVPADFVRRQAELVLDDIGADVVKTGMLFSAEVVAMTAGLLAERGLAAVVDPVMIAKGGAALLRDEAVAAVRDLLLPQTFLLTPNLPEAEALTGLRIDSLETMAAAGRRLQELGARHVLVKGGHLENDATDLLLLAGGETLTLPGTRVATASTHGTGCSYAAALAALLARGLALPDAAATAKRFIAAAIAAAVPLGHGHGPVNHAAGARAVTGNGTTLT